MIYKDYEIEPFTYGFTYAHKDYDGAPEHAYDSPSDIRSGFAESIEVAKKHIDDIEEMLNN